MEEGRWKMEEFAIRTGSAFHFLHLIPAKLFIQDKREKEPIKKEKIMKKKYIIPAIQLNRTVTGDDAMQTSLKPQSFDHADSKPRDDEYTEDEEEEIRMIMEMENEEAMNTRLW